MNLTDKYGHMLPVDKTHQLLSIENMEVTYG